MTKRIRPIGIEKFPNISTNCVGFAIGNTTEVKEAKSNYDLDFKYPIDEAFKVKLSELGYSTSNLRKIESLEDANPDEFIFKIYGFNKYTVIRFGIRIPYYDFHVVRRELDGTWVHKPGWNDAPCIITESDWPSIHEEFGEKFVLFALSTSSEEE